MPDAKSFVDSEIAGNKVVVFSKSYCPFCTKAKKALSSVGADYKAIELDGRSDCDNIQDYLLSITGGRSVPRVFIKGKFIGGGDETAAKARSGELQKVKSRLLEESKCIRLLDTRELENASQVFI